MKINYQLLIQHRILPKNSIFFSSTPIYGLGCFLPAFLLGRLRLFLRNCVRLYTLLASPSIKPSAAKKIRFEHLPSLSDSEQHSLQTENFTTVNDFNFTALPSSPTPVTISLAETSQRYICHP
jgi:hypothetical protein